MLLLYEAEAKGEPVASLLQELPVPPEPFVVDRVTGVEAHRGRIDEVIGAHALGWALSRMPVVDRTLLRLGVFELLFRPEVPVAVVISEAVELAKRFSTEDSGRFVNGVLAAVARAQAEGVAKQAPHEEPGPDRGPRC